MADLIDRKAFANILEAKSDLLRLGCPDNQYGVFLEKVKQMLSLAPAVDAAPVVRCKKCLYSRKRDLSNLEEAVYCAGCLWCNLWQKPIFPEDYCSDGERNGGKNDG